MDIQVEQSRQNEYNEMSLRFLFWFVDEIFLEVENEFEFSQRHIQLDMVEIWTYYQMSMADH